MHCVTIKTAPVNHVLSFIIFSETACRLFMWTLTVSLHLFIFFKISLCFCPFLKKKKKEKYEWIRIQKCVAPWTCFIMGMDGHTFYTKCLRIEHATAALEGADCAHCERFTIRQLHLPRELCFRALWIRSWGYCMDLKEDPETRAALSLAVSSGSGSPRHNSSVCYGKQK